MAVLTAPVSLVTAEDLDRMPDNGRSFEIVDGVLVEVPPVGAYESQIEGRLVRYLGNYTESKGIPGEVMPASARFRLQRDPDTVRGPDVSFIHGDRLPQGRLPSGHLNLAPDLAVEIVSESNTSAGIERKTGEYLDAGVRMVWVIYPDTRTAYIYTSRDAVRWLDEDDELDGRDVLPGFRLPLGKLFEAAGVRPKT